MASDRTTYAPFVLTDHEFRSLILSDTEMLARTHVFAKHEGWVGNGYDWTSVANTIVGERLPEFEDVLAFESEAGMFAVDGPLEALRALGVELRELFADEARLDEVVGRSALD